MTKLTWIVLGAVAAAAACGSHHTAGTSPSGASNSSVITAEEVGRTTATNLYDVVNRLRPRWLRNVRVSALPSAGVSDVVVYVDRSRMGGPDVLKQLQPTSVRSIRYYSPSEAEAEFGLGHLNGVIQVNMATGGR